ncbi:U1 small nuclear ribonucleoprotein C-like [Artemia franciscana]|uniref:U1 small nuclear ribonucleoprotein C n=1 Tax=Artemia franciscana TaxID=6661 RepID=A0AA88LCU6_ARTSF|nr:hypothetical protein QYM36_007451 [Artemia franciscana]
MPKYYCDYCDTYLTHDSPSVRKTHCSGRKHKENVKFFYQKWMEDQAQQLIDATTAAYKAGKISLKPGAAIPPPTGLAGPVPPPAPAPLPGPNPAMVRPMGPNGMVPGPVMGQVGGPMARPMAPMAPMAGVPMMGPGGHMPMMGMRPMMNPMMMGQFQQRQ